MANKTDKVKTLFKEPDGTEHVMRVQTQTNADTDQTHVRVGIGKIQKIPNGTLIPEGAEMIDVKSDGEGWRDVESMYGGKGPAQVNSPAYKSGWDAIWGGKKSRTDLN